MSKLKTKRLAVLSAFIILLNSISVNIYAENNTNEQYYGANKSQYNEYFVSGAYILNGFLYLNSSVTPETIKVHWLLDKQGNEKKEVLTDVRRISDADFNNYVCYALYQGDEPIMFSDGKYEIELGANKYPVVSVVNYRQDSGKRTKNETASELNDNAIPFCDYVYPVIFNNNAYSTLEFEVIGTNQSLNPENWPQILRDGMTEKKNGTDGKQSLTITYPKEKNTNEPKVFEDVFPQNDENGQYSLDHMDKLILKLNSDIVDVYFWDQISKIWYKEMTDESYTDMVYVNGGQFTMGDWNDIKYDYAFDNEPSRRVNMRKLWLNVKDPQFMGELLIGQSAVNVGGLMDQNSSAKDKESRMWITNSDSRDTHEVKLSDYMIGKYEVTMSQFYEFVDSTEGSEDECYYSINGKIYKLNGIAAYAVNDKRGKIRDSGWGSGSRPAIDVNWYEAIEYCNYLSLKEGLDPCYTFTNVYNGKEEDGLTEVQFLANVSGSALQKMPIAEKEVQLVRVNCDFNKNGYRLPTESEYEYAARGGEYIGEGENGNLFSGTNNAGTAYNSTFDNRPYHIWFRNNVDNPQLSGDTSGNLSFNNMGGNGYSNPVGTRMPNSLGIHDLSGNVWEICWDYYNSAYYTELKEEGGIHENPTGPSYDNNQISVMNAYPIDPNMECEWKYSYDFENGSYVRTKAKSLKYSGKLSHTLRGGCFTNPFSLTSTVNRFAPAQTYVDNVINFTDARIGFRVARSVTDKENEKGEEISEEEISEVKNYITSFSRIISSHIDYFYEGLKCFDSDSIIEVMTKDGAEYMDFNMIENWLSKIDRERDHVHLPMNITVKKTKDGYEATEYARYYDQKDDSFEEGITIKYDFKLVKKDGEMKIKYITRTIV